MIPADTVAITSEDVSERAFADILFHNSYFMHIHLFEPTGVNVWQGGLAHDCKLVQLLSSFGQLTLNVITINIKGITTNIVALTELRAIPSTTTTFTVALNKDFTDLLCLGNSARRYSTWIQYSMDKLKDVTTGMLVDDAIPATNQEKWVYASHVLGINKMANRERCTLGIKQSADSIRQKMRRIAPSNPASVIWVTKFRNRTKCLVTTGDANIEVGAPDSADSSDFGESDPGADGDAGYSADFH
jgi:hypothetical protein